MVEKKDYSPVPAVIQVALSVLIHICGMHIFSRDTAYYILLIKGGIASGSVHTYILLPHAEIVGINF